MEYFSQVPEKNYTAQLVLGPNMADGLDKDGAALGITQTTAAMMRTKTAALKLTNNNFNNARAAQEGAYANFHAADDALTSWMGKVTGALSTFFGKRWNRQWVPVGFITPSIRVPDSVQGRLEISETMIEFLRGNPEKESANQEVTAAIGQTLRDAVLATQKVARDADAAVTNTGNLRSAASADLVAYMKTLIGVLARLLSAEDTRWLDFGLEIPGRLVTPQGPTGLTVVASPGAKGANADTVTVLLNWEPTPFATRYRVRRRFVGMLGDDWQLVARTPVPTAQVNVPANVTVEFVVQAVNEDRQSVPSAPAAFGPMVNAAPTSVASASTEEVLSPAPNGSNGHSNGSRLPALK